MAFMRIRCDYCGGKWEVYERNFTDELNKYCPHCGKGIPEEMWGDVKKSFGYYVDTNCELIKDSIGYQLPLFQVDFISDYLFKQYTAHKRKGKKNDRKRIERHHATIPGTDK